MAGTGGSGEAPVLRDAKGPLPLQCATAFSSSSDRPAETAQDMIAHSIVRIHAYSREYNLLRPFQQTGINKGVGSGVIIDSALLGSVSRARALYILTCEHVGVSSA